ncbi:hypothetical protein LJC08_02015 [Methanimicrococcus sp. OttesenSCG-928-J09]|nr:hypothetical protein [Methanimicrococcus sp. OttesenSCG-928-J09]
MLFGSFFYGFFSKAPVKAGFLGFLFPVIFLILVYFDSGSAEIQRIFWYHIIQSFIGLFSGFLAGVRTKNVDLNAFCFLLAIGFIILGFFHFLSGTN